MKRVKRCLAYTAALIFLATHAVSADGPLFSLTMAPPSAPLKSGAELRLLVTVTNTSDRTIGFIRSLGQIPDEWFRYKIRVHNEAGQSAPVSAYVRELKNKQTLDFQSSYARWLKPGESFVDNVEITKCYDLSLPGTYTISVAREFPPAQNLGTGYIKSNTITVTVTK